MRVSVGVAAAVAIALLFQVSPAMADPDFDGSTSRHSCDSSTVPIRMSHGHFIWQQPMLRLTAANHFGKVAVFDGHRLQILGLLGGSSQTLRIAYPMAALTISDHGTVAWLESDANNTHWVLHTLQHSEQASAPIASQPWRVPETWKKLYFSNDQLYISDQGGKLIHVQSNQKTALALRVEVPSTDQVDLTAPLGPTTYFQYRWKVAVSGGIFSSSVTLESQLAESARHPGIRLSQIFRPIVDWKVIGKNAIFVTSNTTEAGVHPLVHLVRISDGTELAHLDYGDGCRVVGIDVIGGSRLAALLLNDEVLQVVDLNGLKVVDQIALPKSPEYSAVSSVVAVDDGEYIVRTGWGVAVVASDR